jgi:hypothetical protein
MGSQAAKVVSLKRQSRLPPDKYILALSTEAE